MADEARGFLSLAESLCAATCTTSAARTRPTQRGALTTRPAALPVRSSAWARHGEDRQRASPYPATFH